MFGLFTLKLTGFTSRLLLSHLNNINVTSSYSFRNQFNSDL